MRRGFGTVLAVGLLAPGTGCTVLDLPDDLCDAVGTALIAQLVPGTPAAGSPRGGRECTVRADSRRGTGSAWLEVQLHTAEKAARTGIGRRNGLVGPTTAFCNHAVEKDPQRSAVVEDAQGWGGKACSVLQHDPGERQVTQYVAVKVDDLVLWVSYHAAPSTPELTAPAVRAVVGNVRRAVVGAGDEEPGAPVAVDRLPESPFVRP